MGLSDLLMGIGAFLLQLAMLHMVCAKNLPKGSNIKKIRLKFFWFLFCEGDSYRTKEVSIQVIVFTVVGYIIALLVFIAFIICYCIGIDFRQYIPWSLLSVLIACFLFNIAFT